MIKNSLMKFIDSCVGNIARKIEDEFNESDHPRDKGGKFTSKGSGSGSWSGGGGYKAGPEGKKVSKISNDKADKLNEYAKRLEEAGHDPKDIHAMNVQGDLKGMKKALSQYEGEGSSNPSASKGKVKPSNALSPEQKELAGHVFNSIMTESLGQNDFDTVREAREYVQSYIDMMLEDAEGWAENYGISTQEAEAAIKHAAKSWKSSAQYKDPWESFYEDPYEDDDDEEDDADVSLEQYKKNVSENFDGDEEYEVEARYDRAKYHSDKFKKLQNGEYDGTPEEKRLKNYYRRLGIKKPEDAFKVWWDI